MQENRKAVQFKIFDARNFSAREALWVAILLHLIILVLPQSWNPFLLFWHDFKPVQPQPITFRIKQPDEQQPEQTELSPEEKHAAVTPEKLDGPPKTKQPTVRGETNLRALEAPPEQMRPQQRSEQPPPRETGLKQVDPFKQPTPETQREELEARERTRKLIELLENQSLYKPSDFPILYDNPQPSEADQLNNFVQFDTYDWNYEPYRDRMIRKLYQFWVPKLRGIPYFRLGKAGRTVYRFTIRRDGSLEAVSLLGPSNTVPYDMAAEYAIVSKYFGLATAFPPLPDHFPKESLTVTVGFFVNMDIPNRSR